MWGGVGWCGVMCLMIEYRLEIFLIQYRTSSTFYDNRMAEDNQGIDREEFGSE